MKCFILFAPLLLPALASANGYLQVGGNVISLTGGVQDGYSQVLTPATLRDTASGSQSNSLHAGGYSTGYADIYGEAHASSSSSFGLLGETSSASARGYAAYSAAESPGGTAAYALDTITVHGTGPITITLHTLLVGSALVSSTNNVIDGGSARVRAFASVSPDGFFDPTKEIDLGYDYSTGSVFNSVLSSSVVVSDGQAFGISGGLAQNAGGTMLNGNFDPQALRTVTSSTTASLGYWITLSSGASLTSESGYLYGAPRAVPEPTSILALGLGAVVALRRRRR